MDGPGRLARPFGRHDPGPGRLAFGLDNETLVVLNCSSGGLAPEGWPKIGRTAGQGNLA